jgi:hypothetical protein
MTYFVFAVQKLKETGTKFECIKNSHSQPGCLGTLECQKEVSGMPPKFELLPFNWCFTTYDDNDHQHMMTMIMNI